jgi:hypothetical protein
VPIRHVGRHGQRGPARLFHLVGRFLQPSRIAGQEGDPVSLFGEFQRDGATETG